MTVEDLVPGDAKGTAASAGALAPSLITQPRLHVFAPPLLELLPRALHRLAAVVVEFAVAGGLGQPVELRVQRGRLDIATCPLDVITLGA